MKYRWLSWYAVPDTVTENGDFELYYPWWISGYRCSDGAAVICAAIPLDRSAAIEAVFDSYDERPGRIEWRFNDEADGSPFCDRFPRAAWMKWAPVLDRKKTRKP